MALDLTRFKALTFDVYGTLIDWEPSIIAMFQSVADQYHVELSREQLLLEFDRARAQLHYMYGPDPGRLYRVTSPILKSSRLTAHSEVTKWYGARRETFVIR